MTDAGAAASSAEASGRRGWLLLAAVAGGVFVAADDQTSVVTLLPSMIRDLGITVDDFYRSSWIVNGYLLGYIVAVPLVGRVADLYGHARIYAAALALFMLGSALTAAAPSFEWLVAARALQAVGGGAVVPVAMAIIADELPPARRAMGLGAIAAASEGGALLGPLWGGAITQWLDWRWVFWSNLPLTLPLLAIVWRARAAPSRAGALDWPGATVLAAALATLTVALVDDPVQPRPLPATAALLALAVVLGVLFLWRERRATEPLVRLSMFAPRAAWAANAAALLLGGGLITVLIAVPLFVNIVLAESPLDGGLTLMRFTLAVPLGALAGGWLATRAGVRATALTGMWLAAAGFMGLRGWDRELSEAWRTLPQLAGGFGFGLVIAPLGAAVLERVREHERATASAWLTLSRVAGMLVGASLLTSHGLGRFYAKAGAVTFDSPDFVALVQSAQLSTFHEVFIGGAAVMFAGGLVAWLIGRGERGGERKPWWTLT
ncbi:MAG: MFS transporter [Dehalococcoidia bacterium]|nr:MFS transporter [Dehalococcoidia bacterium]